MGLMNNREASNFLNDEPDHLSDWITTRYSLTLIHNSRNKSIKRITGEL